MLNLIIQAYGIVYDEIKTVYILSNHAIIFSCEKRIQKDSGMVRLESNSENMLISTYHLRK